MCANTTAQIRHGHPSKPGGGSQECALGNGFGVCVEVLWHTHTVQRFSVGRGAEIWPSSPSWAAILGRKSKRKK